MEGRGRGAPEGVGAGAVGRVEAGGDVLITAMCRKEVMERMPGSRTDQLTAREMRVAEKFPTDWEQKTWCVYKHTLSARLPVRNQSEQFVTRSDVRQSSPSKLHV